MGFPSNLNKKQILLQPIGYSEIATFLVKDKNSSPCNCVATNGHKTSDEFLFYVKFFKFNVENMDYSP